MTTKHNLTTKYYKQTFLWRVEWEDLSGKVSPTQQPSGTAIESDQKVSLLIWDLCAQGTYYIINIWVVNMDVASYLQKTLDKILAVTEREKKRNCLDFCLQQRRHFYPFIVSVNGLLGIYAEAMMKRLYRSLSTKWWQPYSRTFGYVQSRFAITILQTTNYCI